MFENIGKDSVSPSIFQFGENTTLVFPGQSESGAKKTQSRTTVSARSSTQVRCEMKMRVLLP